MPLAENLDQIVATVLSCMSGKSSLYCLTERIPFLKGMKTREYQFLVLKRNIKNIDLSC